MANITNSGISTINPFAKPLGFYTFSWDELEHNDLAVYGPIDESLYYPIDEEIKGEELEADLSELLDELRPYLIWLEPRSHQIIFAAIVFAIFALAFWINYFLGW